MYKREKGKGGCISRQRERRGGRVLEDTYMPSVQRRARYILDREEGSSSACIGPRTERFSFLQLSLPLCTNTCSYTLPVSPLDTHTYTHPRTGTIALGYTSRLWQSSSLLFLLLVGLSGSTACASITGWVNVCVESGRQCVKDATGCTRVSRLLPSSLSFSFCSF